MKVAVLADAHGNKYGFNAALENAKINGADMIVSAGDMLIDFPGGVEILQVLLSENIPCVLGNADELMLKWWHSEPNGKLRTSPQFNPLRSCCDNFMDSIFKEIEKWPMTKILTIDQSNIVLCHGTPKSNSKFLNSSDWLDSINEFSTDGINAILAGHDHSQWSKTINGILHVLAGSCGMPCGGDIRAQYTILKVSNGSIEVEHHSIDYDRKSFFSDIKSNDYVKKTAPIGWLALSQILTATPLMLYYFRDRFDPKCGTDIKYLINSVRSHLKEYKALSIVEDEFGPLII
jgi:putative phosphoesterase